MSIAEGPVSIVPRESAFSFLKSHPIIVVKVSLVALTLMYSGGLMAAGCHLDNPKMLGYVISAEVLGVGGLIPCAIILGCSERDRMMDALLVRAEAALDRIWASRKAIEKLQREGHEIAGAEEAIDRAHSIGDVHYLDKIREVSKKVKKMESAALELEKIEQKLIKAEEAKKHEELLRIAKVERDEENLKLEGAKKRVKDIYGDIDRLLEPEIFKNETVSSSLFKNVAEALVQMAKIAQEVTQIRQQKINALMSRVVLVGYNQEDQTEIEAILSSEIELQGVVGEAKSKLRLLANMASGLPRTGSEARSLRREIELAQEQVEAIPAIKFTLLAADIL